MDAFRLNRCLDTLPRFIQHCVKDNMKSKILVFMVLVFPMYGVLAQETAISSVEMDSATKLIEEIEVKKINYESCRKKAGKYAYKYDYINYMWDIKAALSLGVAESIIDALSSSQRGKIDKTLKAQRQALLATLGKQDGAEHAKYCGQYFMGLMQGNVGSLNAIESSLQHKFGAAGERRIKIRNRDIEVGCVKEHYNANNTDFRGAIHACGCITNLMFSKISDADIDKYLDFVHSKEFMKASSIISENISAAELASCGT